jgi:hypothetical protein
MTAHRLWWYDDQAIQEALAAQRGVNVNELTIWRSIRLCGHHVLDIRRKGKGGRSDVSPRWSSE